MRRYILRAAVVCGFLVAGAATGTPTARAETLVAARIPSQRVDFALYLLADGLNTPWGIAELPDGSLLVTERTGGLVHYRDGEVTAITGVPEVVSVGQGGLLGVVLAPDYPQSKQIYFAYSRQTVGGYQTAVGKAQFDQAARALRGARTIFASRSVADTRVHFGSRLAFLPDGTLLVTIGDRGNRHNAQDGSNHAGAVIRIDVNGGVPGDNPFLGESLPDGGGRYLPELYSIGHRNAQGLFVDDEGTIWLHEHGPRGGDEINIITAGKNYGWPVVSYGREYRGGDAIGIGVSAPGYEDPLVEWTPSIAPSGLIRYSGKMFPEWEGDLFVGALAGKHLRRVEIGTRNRVVGQESLLVGQIGRIRDILEAQEDGAIYVITDKKNGGLYRIARR